MSVLAKLFGVLLILAGVVLGVYVDIWVFLVGGIVDIIDGAKATPTDGGMIGWGIVKAFVLSGFGFFICIFFLIVPGAALIGFNTKRVRMFRRR